LPGDVRPLTVVELSTFRGRFAAGWLLPVSFPTAHCDLFILVDHLFPRTQPKIALAERPPTLSLPHVDNDGLLCLFPDASGTDPHEPLLVVQHVLGAAVTLLEEVFAGEHTDDFRNEFLSYWAIACDGSCIPVQSLLRLGPPTRAVRVWRGTKKCVVGDDDASVLHWIANRLQNPKFDQTTDAGLFIWLEQPLLPREYPRSGRDVLALAHRAGGADLMAGLLNEEKEELVTLVGATHSPWPLFGEHLSCHPHRAALARRTAV